MEHKLAIKYLIIYFSILIIGFGSLYVIFIKPFRPVNSKTIIKKFISNENLFEEAINELFEFEEEFIYIDKDGETISITIYQHIDNEVNIIKIEQEDFYKYEKTIYIMQEFNLNHVWKEEENIIFSMTDFGQNIVKMNNEERFRKSYHIIDEIEIENNWYYIKIN